MMENRDKKALAVSKEMNKRSREYTEHAPTREDAKKIVQKRKEDSRRKIEATRRPVSRKKESTSHAKKQRVVSIQAKNSRKNRGKKKKKRKKKKGASFLKNPHVILISALIIAVCIALTLITIFSIRSMSAGVDPDSGTFKHITIEKGSTASSIASLLEEEGIVESGQDFLAYVDKMGTSTALNAGSYHFSLSSDYQSVHEALRDQKSSKMITVTIYDGSDIEMIDSLLAQRQLIVPGEFIEAADQVMKERNLSFIEGWLLGGTYTFEREEFSPYALADESVEAMMEELKAYRIPIVESDRSLEEVIVIASMVQRETQDPDQMPLIAQVIYNRLELDEPLGIDATTRYALSKWDEPLEKGDFSDSKDYNTRSRKGLPPAGIGTVGEEALNAALFPSHHDYLFYLHDEKGELHPAKTYQEHLENIERYL